MHGVAGGVGTLSHYFPRRRTDFIGVTISRFSRLRGGIVASGGFESLSAVPLDFDGIRFRTVIASLLAFDFRCGDVFRVLF